MRHGARGTRHGVISENSLVPRASCPAPRACWSTAGFTLLEMLAVLMLFGIALAMIVPRFATGDPLGRSTRQFVNLMYAVQVKAIAMQKTWRLHLDADQKTYWATVIEPDGERTPTDATLANRITLPPSVRFLDITTARQGTFQTGEGYLQIPVTGRVEPGVIQLADDQQNVVAIQIQPVTGLIRLWEQRLEAKPADSIPLRLRPLL